MMTMSDIEIRRLEEQVQLDERKSPGQRNRWGQFATPPGLALDIANYSQRLWEQEPINDGVRFLDPCIGTGSFYSAFLQSFRGIKHAATGVELDPEFANAARRLWIDSPLNVEQADFTSLDPRPVFNLILTNPPYVRHHHLSSKEKERLQRLVRNRLGLATSGLSGLYCHFLLLADAWLAPSGLAVWLIPSEFMAVNYGTAVKEYLLRHVSLIHVHRFSPDDVQFSDALVSSAIVVFRKRKPPSDHFVRFSFGGPITKPIQKEDVRSAALDARMKWTCFADPSSNRAEPDHRLGDLFAIKRGLATGDNSFFILERDRARELNIPEDFLRPILPSPRYMDRDVIEAADDGYPILDKQLCLIDCPLSEEEIRRAHPSFFAYLEKGRSENVHRGYLASRRIPWYSQEQRPPAPFLCTYMGRSASSRNGSPFRFLWNKSNATAANVYLMLYPKPLLAKAMARAPTLEKKLYAVLSRTASDLFLKESRVYGGGLHKLEPSELARLDISAVMDELDLPARYRQGSLFAD